MQGKSLLIGNELSVFLKIPGRCEDVHGVLHIFSTEFLITGG